MFRSCSQVLAILAIFDTDGDFALSLAEVNTMNVALGQPVFSDEENLRRVAEQLGHSLSATAAFPYDALIAAYASDAELAGDVSALISAKFLPPRSANSYEDTGRLSLLGRMQVYGLACTFGDGASLSLAQINQMNAELGQPPFTFEGLATLADGLGHPLQADGRFSTAALLAAYENGDDALGLSVDVAKIASSGRPTRYGFSIGDLCRSVFSLGQYSGSPDQETAASPPEAEPVLAGAEDDSEPEPQASPAAVVPGRKAELNGSDRCVVCLESKRCCALIPCGHVAACEEHSVALIDGGAACPICHAQVRSALRVYF